MEQGLDLSVVALLAILVIGFYVFVIRGRRSEPAPRKPPANGPDPAGSPPPLAFEPFVVGNGQWGEHLRIDVRHRQHGCDAAGAPTSESGAYDPANERLEFWFEADGPDENGKDVRYTVFDAAGERIDRRWLSRDFFDVYHRDRRDPTSPTEQNAVVDCFIGHTADQPPFPMATAMGCGCRPPGDRLQPDLGEQLGTMQILYKVRDPKGQQAVGGRRMPVYGKPC